MKTTLLILSLAAISLFGYNKVTSGSSVQSASGNAPVVESHDNDPFASPYRLFIKPLGYERIPTYTRPYVNYSGIKGEGC